MRADRWIGTVLGVLAAGIALAGCGAGEESSVPKGRGGVTTSSLGESDQAHAQRIVVTAADLPAGFTADPNEGGDEDDFDRSMATCLHDNQLLLRIGQADDPRGATSPDFERERVTVASAATFGEDEREARAAMAELGAASFPDCFARAATDAARADPDFKDSTIATDRLPTASAADGTIAVRNRIANVRGTRVTVYVDIVFVRSGRAVAYLIATDVGTPFPDGERERLVAAMAERM